MIEFKCACAKYQFSVPDDMAGGLIQCPRCRRLVDVPTLNELGQIASDGGYKFDDELDAPAPPIAPHARALKAGRTDRDGQDIDLRSTFEDVQRAGVTSAPGMLPNGKPVAPKYDILTGELIRPLAVTGEEPQRVLPVEALGNGPHTVENKQPTPAPRLDYSARLTPTISIAGVPLVLLRPVNLLVMAIVLMCHALVHITAIVTAMGFFFVFPAPLVLLMALIAHYGNVVEETGPSGRDELPTVIRNASFFEDIWWPFVQVVLGLMTAYFPLFLLPFWKLAPDANWIAMIVLFAWGSFVAPALVFTQVASGAIENMRPDRVIGVIATCGLRYLVVVGMFVVAIVVYTVGFVMAWNGVVFLLKSKQFALGLATLGGGYGVLAAAIYLMHIPCLQLGLLYRVYHEMFPWILQRHVPTKMRERTRPRAGHLISPAKKTTGHQ